MQKISYKTTGSIWKIIPLDHTHICVEIRDKVNFKAEWKIFSVESEHCSYSYTTDNNSWWHHIVEVQTPYIFLHELKQGKNPEINSLKLVDFEKNTVESHEKLQFESAEESHILVSDKLGLRKKISLRLETKKTTISSPIIYPKESKHFEIFEEIVKSYTTFGIQFECEYLETTKVSIIGFYVENENKTFDSYIMVLGNNGELLLLENNHQQLKGKSEGLFFLQNDKLIYTKNENEIIINTL